MTPLAAPAVPVSWGELLDKIAILEIKRDRIRRPDALANVEKEHAALSAIGATARRRSDIAPLYRALRRVNEALWEIEDSIREEEAHARFGVEFIGLARAVYRTNDERAALKRRINVLLGSELTEEKSYAETKRPCSSASGRHVERDEPEAVRRDVDRRARGRIAAEQEQAVDAQS